MLKRGYKRLTPKPPRFSKKDFNRLKMDTRGFMKFERDNLIGLNSYLKIELQMNKIIISSKFAKLQIKFNKFNPRKNITCFPVKITIRINHGYKNLYFYNEEQERICALLNFTCHNNCETVAIRYYFYLRDLAKNYKH